ncbi:MAG: hypothetical protein ABJA87_11860 [bacterium]
MASGIAGTVLASIYLAAPVAGTDLSAQVARADFVRLHGLRPVDFGWYGGVFPYGYSLFTGPVDAVAGARVVGAVAAVAGAVAFADLLARTRVRRPLLGGLLGAASLVFNVVSGRITFAVGLAFGLLALSVLGRSASGAAGAAGATGGRRAAVAVTLLALFSAAASPVAGVFVVIAGAALIIAGRRRDGALLVGGATGPLLSAALVFSDGGASPFSAQQATIFVVFALAVVVLVPVRYRAVQAGALLTAAAVLAGHLVASPLGGNTARLPLLFAVPVVAATAALSPPWLAGAVVSMVLWQPPVVLSDVTGAGARATQAAFFAPLIRQLDRRRPLGRLEVVPLRDHWEAVDIAERVVPLARGWERQADVGRNPIFYAGPLTAATYQRWLRQNAVAMVGVPRGQPLDPAGVRERALVATGLPYLRLVWSTADWQLYAVQDAEPVVSRPARTLSSDPAGVTFETDGAGRLAARLRFSRWLTLSGPAGACLARSGDWTAVTVTRRGRYRISSAWNVRPGRRC